MLVHEIIPILEIAADYKLHRQPDGGQVYEFIPRLDDSVRIGVSEIKNIMDSFTKEELIELDNVCHETGRHPHVLNMSILSTYSIENSNDAHVKQLQNALKHREPKKGESTPSFISNDNWNNMVVRAIEEIKKPKFAKGTRNVSLIKELSEIFNTIDSSWNIAYLASSSRVPEEIATILSKKTGARVVSRVFKKSTPNLSKWVVGGPDNGKPRDESVLNSSLNPAYAKSTQRANAISYSKQTNIALAGGDDASNMIRKQNKAKKAVAKTFEIKSYPRMAMKDGVRGLYGMQKVDKDHRVLDNKPLIIVDDNYQSNRSLIDAIKSLYKAGIFPTEILLFCPHKMMNTGKQQDLTRGTELTNNQDNTSLKVNPIDKNWDNVPFNDIPVDIINDMVDSLVIYKFTISRIVSEYETTYDRTTLMSAIIHNLPTQYTISQSDYATILSELIGYMKIILKIPVVDIMNQLSHPEFTTNWGTVINSAIGNYKRRHSIPMHSSPAQNTIKNIPQQDRVKINNLIDQGVTPAKIRRMPGNDQYTIEQIIRMVRGRRLVLKQQAKKPQDQINQKKHIISLLNNGASALDIQQQYPALTTSMINSLKSRIKPENAYTLTHLPISTIKQIHTMSVNGYTISQIADKLDISSTVARDWSISGREGKRVKKIK